jgi:serine/threonine protein kinase
MNSKDEKGYKKEIEILKQANHPFVIEYIEDFINKNDQVCIVTKFASGGDLEKLMKNTNISEKEALDYFAMILLALHYLHSINIFHRDLKPDNILLDEVQDGLKIVKIGDFGISKIDIKTLI